MIAGRVVALLGQCRTLPSLRPSSHSLLLTTCLKEAPSRCCYSDSTQLRRVLASFKVVSISRQYFSVRRLFLPKVQRHWRRWVTAGTLCGSVLGGVALSENKVTTTHSPSHCKSVAQGDDAVYQVHIADQSGYCNVTFSQFTLREKIYVIFRCLYLACLFSPTLVLYGASRLFRSTRLETLSWAYTMRAVQMAGPAFIKLGQWASTRRDLFSEEFCDSLSQLHASCQAHRWLDTLQTLEEEFGSDWREMLDISEGEPIGSGCVAQVYKGTLKTRALPSSLNEEPKETKRASENSSEKKESRVISRIARGLLPKERKSSTGQKQEVNERGTPVAVKVLHPGTVQAMERDMLLMRYGAYWMDWLNPNFHWVALKECFSEFSIVMRKQLDMELEAYNLRKFQEIMGDNDNVKFPTPLFPYVTKRVLVETFETGSHISSYMDNPGGKLQKTLARIGTTALLDMLFIHNFVHGDLHPGNILVQDSPRPRLVILDCGIATSLTQFDLLQMRALFTAIVKGDGEHVADLMLGTQPCPTVDEYRRNMADLVTRGVQNLTQVQNIKVSSLFSELFDVLMKHKVRIEPNYTSVVMAIMVIEGLGRSLDPSLNLLEAVAPCLLHRAARDLTSKIVGS